MLDTGAAAHDKPTRKRVREAYEFKLTHLPIYLILTIGAIICLTPFLYMIATSLMTLGETILRQVVPESPQWQNYSEAWNEAKFDLYFRNSIIITALTILGLLVTSVLSAYAFARIEFPGRNLLFMMLLATLMIPTTVTFIPNLLLVRGTMDQGPEAARDFVQGFVSARLEDEPCVCLWLIGLPAVRFAGEANAEAWYRELQVEGLGSVWALPGLELLMEEPQRKADVWQAMRRLMARWKTTDE